MQLKATFLQHVSSATSSIPSPSTLTSWLIGAYHAPGSRPEQVWAKIGQGHLGSAYCSAAPLVSAESFCAAARPTQRSNNTTTSLPYTALFWPSKLETSVKAQKYFGSLQLLMGHSQRGQGRCPRKWFQKRKLGICGRDSFMIEGSKIQRWRKGIWSQP